MHIAIIFIINVYYYISNEGL